MASFCPWHSARNPWNIYGRWHSFLFSVESFWSLCRCPSMEFFSGRIAVQTFPSFQEPGTCHSMFDMIFMDLLACLCIFTEKHVMPWAPKKHQAPIQTSHLLPRNVLLIVNIIALGAIYIQAGFNMVEECRTSWRVIKAVHFPIQQTRDRHSSVNPNVVDDDDDNDDDDVEEEEDDDDDDDDAAAADDDDDDDNDDDDDGDDLRLERTRNFQKHMQMCLGWIAISDIKFEREIINLHGGSCLMSIKKTHWGFSELGGIPTAISKMSGDLLRSNQKLPEMNARKHVTCTSLPYWMEKWHSYCGWKQSCTLDSFFTRKTPSGFRISQPSTGAFRIQLYPAPSLSGSGHHRVPHFSVLPLPSLSELVTKTGVATRDQQLWND